MTPYTQLPFDATGASAISTALSIGGERVIRLRRSGLEPPGGGNEYYALDGIAPLYKGAYVSDLIDGTRRLAGSGLRIMTWGSVDAPPTFEETAWLLDSTSWVHGCPLDHKFPYCAPKQAGPGFFATNRPGSNGGGGVVRTTILDQPVPADGNAQGLLFNDPALAFHLDGVGDIYSPFGFSTDARQIGLTALRVDHSQTPTLQTVTMYGSSPRVSTWLWDRTRGAWASTPVNKILLTPSVEGAVGYILTRDLVAVVPLDNGPTVYWRISDPLSPDATATQVASLPSRAMPNVPIAFGGNLDFTDVSNPEAPVTHTLELPPAPANCDVGVAHPIEFDGRRVTYWCLDTTNHLQIAEIELLECGS